MNIQKLTDAGRYLFPISRTAIFILAAVTALPAVYTLIFRPPALTAYEAYIDRCAKTRAAELKAEAKRAEIEKFKAIAEQRKSETEREEKKKPIAQVQTTPSRPLGALPEGALPGGLPAGWRLEIPKRLNTTVPVRWSVSEAWASGDFGKRNLTANESKSIATALAQGGEVEAASEIKNGPFGQGLVMTVVPTSHVLGAANGVTEEQAGKMGGGQRNPFRIVLFSCLTGEKLDTALQSLADGSFPKIVDLSHALPFFRDGMTIYAVLAENSQIAEAWDWKNESEKKKAELVAKAKASKGPEQDAEVLKETKAARDAGYDL